MPEASRPARAVQSAYLGVGNPESSAAPAAQRRKAPTTRQRLAAKHEDRGAEREQEEWQREAQRARKVRERDLRFAPFEPRRDEAAVFKRGFAIGAPARVEIHVVHEQRAFARARHAHLSAVR